MNKMNWSMNLLSAVLCLSAASISHGGTLGAVTTKEQVNFSPFIGLEGNYSWYTSNKTLFINSQPFYYKHNGWGGRISGGLDMQYANHMSYTTELGWGYFAQSSSTNNSSAAYVSRASFYGFDLLLGMAYQYRLVNLFAKAGAMAMNRDSSATLDYSKINGVGSLSGNSSTDSLSTFFMPEIKFGIEYPSTERLKLSLSYMHLFGSNTKYTTVLNVSPDQLYSAMSWNRRPPSFDTIFLGLRYQFS